jgi:HAD superfamily hydrolase (TIGR01509 family)
MHPAAVIFDFDGTIADTEWPVYEAARIAHHHHGLALPVQEWVKIIGAADNPTLEDRLKRRLGRDPDPEAIEQAKALHTEAREGVPVLPGVLDLIGAVKAAARGLSIASSSPIGWVEGHLQRLGLIEHFDALSTRDQVDRGKPAPDLFILAAAKLELDPGDVIVIEDSKNGAIAAKAAGMTCIVVPNSITKHDIPAEADMVLDSLIDFPYAEFGLERPV